ncbi:YcjX family protein [Aeromonas allosaccharophila]|uniref:YcjX family protein n=1 Tax=Aeromonas allosaccharophila TaxID=656 RepID=UPI0039875D05
MILNKLEQKLTRLQHKANDVVNRVRDRHIRLAVTGLSRSGKTAFITALVNQLEHAAIDGRLPLWDALRQGRILGARRVPQLNAHIPTFAYERGLDSLFGDPPAWPEPTRGVAEVRLEIRYRTRHPLRKHLGEISTLYVDLVDYPGEWLLDLPLLEMNYEQWSEQVREQLRRPELQALAASWLTPGWQADQRFEERPVAELAECYTAYLHACKQELGLHLIQPGRFVLPGEYAGAPMLQFVPWVWEMPASEPADGTLYATLKQRFEQYKQHLVQGFYQQHFAGFDRQIVLVDCLQPLNAGAASFGDMQQAIARIMESFAYGKSNWWRRLFSPRIDKLLFVASKADHVTPEQHAPMVSLLQHLVRSGRGQARFEGITTECLALAAIKATEVGKGVANGREFPAIRGTSLSGESLLLFPGEVPPHIPPAQWWNSQGFDFQAFRPMPMSAHQALPHIRLDAALEFLLGDHLE